MMRKMKRMEKRDMIDDLVDIVYPMPTALPDDADENAHDALHAECDQVDGQRHALETHLRLQDEFGDSRYDYDALLDQIRDARREMLDAEERMRMLIAYGREFIKPRPYQLKELAAATGMSISGTRGAYTVEEIAAVARRIGRQPRFRTDERATD